jgi:hypothetical protein
MNSHSGLTVIFSFVSKTFSRSGFHPSEPRVGIKKPTQKNPPKKTQKTHLKKPIKNVFFGGFLGFFKFLIFYENNTNFSLSNRFFMNK